MDEPALDVGPATETHDPGREGGPTDMDEPALDVGRLTARSPEALNDEPKGRFRLVAPLERETQEGESIEELATLTALVSSRMVEPAKVMFGIVGPNVSDLLTIGSTRLGCTFIFLLDLLPGLPPLSLAVVDVPLEPPCDESMRTVR